VCKTSNIKNLGLIYIVNALVYLFLGILWFAVFYKSRQLYLSRHFDPDVQECLKYVNMVPQTQAYMAQDAVQAVAAPYQPPAVKIPEVSPLPDTRLQSDLSGGADEF
jgi:hypothetical protein